MSMKNPVRPPRIDPGTVRIIAQRLNHCAIPGSCSKYFLSTNTSEQQKHITVTFTKNLRPEYIRKICASIYSKMYNLPISMEQQPLAGLLVVEASRSHSTHHTWYKPSGRWSAPCRNLYNTTHNTQKRKTPLVPVGFEPAVLANE